MKKLFRAMRTFVFQTHTLLSPTTPYIASMLYLSTDVTRNLLKKIQLQALQSAAANLSIPDLDGITEVTEEMGADESFLRRIHHVLFEIHVIDGFLICPESGRRFPIKDGIPNMLLHEDEV